jgi:ATP-dependent Lhr-like helicase
MNDPLQGFHPVVAQWFRGVYGTPSAPQRLGWPAISSGRNTLILAPTGSGKTLAAFLWAINHLVEQHLREDLRAGVRILYISPLKALNNDIERNLASPLKGIRECAIAAGLRLPLIRTAVRTGDTPQSKRAAMIKHPPDILITTPESLYLLLTSRDARTMLRTVQYVIIDEIHSVCGNKRGVHLSISLERLQAVAEQELIRIGLSATQRPLDLIAAYLVGQEWKGRSLTPREVTVIDAGRRKEMELKVVCPPPDFSLLPQESVWPLVFRHLLEQIRLHRTTLIFVNNRRLAERIAATLNEMIVNEASPGDAHGSRFNFYAVPRRTDWSRDSASSTTVSAPDEGDDSSMLVQAYHGSMSRQARERMEEELKAGRLRALVATSSLELGIDIGSIELVVQVQSPKGIARGLQRVGRSGHLVTATSKGRIFPTHREDLVESAVVARAMLQHEVEITKIPADCLDVLAQQIVAMVSVEEWDVDALFNLVRQSYCYRTLPRKLFLNVIQMLAGRYTDETFRELRARISWDTVNGVLRALPGSRQLAVTGGGTIADRGAYGVYLEDRTTKVGEVDEEFIHESRTGDTFILGSNIWRMTSIDANRVTVVPAPGEPARMPFWRGEGIGRSYELGAMVGAFRREVGERVATDGCLSWLRREYPIDHNAAWNIQEYFRRQRDSTGAVPHDRLILVEHFRDEIGDPRIVVHSSYGRSVNGLLGLFLLRQVQAATGAEPQMLYNDDGILLRTPDMSSLPLNPFEGLTLRAVEETVLDELLSSTLFGGQFRQNASRALLLPKLAPAKRTPLWLQRLRAGDLLQIARKFDDFPIVIETIREILADILDFEHFKEIISGIEEGRIEVRTAQTEVPSPFAASLLFDFVAMYMYETDQPRADRTGQYRAINREVLSDVVDLNSVPSLLRPEAVTLVAEQLQHVAEGRKARSAEELMEILLRIGDLSESEIIERCSANAHEMLETLRRDGRAVAVQLPGGERWIAGEHRTLYDTLSEEPNLAGVFKRYLESHGPVSLPEIAERYGVSLSRAESTLGTLANDPSVVRGKFRPKDREAGEMEWCYRPNLERIRRQTIAVLRKEIRPCSLAEFSEYLFRWQHLHRESRLSGEAATGEILSQLHALTLPCEIWEREILMRRIPHYDRAMMSSLGAGGAIVWQGMGSGRMRFLVRGEAAAYEQQALPPGERPVSEPADRVLKHLRKHGASFFNDIRSATRLSLQALNTGIAELFWNGFITNDVFAELLQVKRTARLDVEVPIERVEVLTPRRNPYRSHLLQAARKALRQVPGWSGRWFLLRVPDVLGPALPLEEQAARQASQLLERYGIVAREFHRREDLLPWPLIAAELQRLELRGDIRRGYFVEGLSGMQFALPDAAEQLRRMQSERTGTISVILINACDPANPYGPGIDLPLTFGVREPIRFNRIAGNFLAFRNGVPFLLIENSGARIWSADEADQDSLRSALRSFVGLLHVQPSLRSFHEIVVEQVNGAKPSQSVLADLLRSFGFERERNQTLRLDEYTAKQIP